MATRKPLIAGNWKMHKTVGETVAFIEALSKQVAGLAQRPDVLVCPPFTALAAAQEKVSALKSPVLIGAQTMDWHEQGAYTGEISPLMLKDLGVRWAVIGHSERRQYYNETDETVCKKAKTAFDHGIFPILCVGETLEEREAGETDDVIRRQVNWAIQDLDPTLYLELVMAYEPVWAIGTGKTCDAAEANRVCKLIRDTIAERGNAEQVRILYGGSVKPDNSRELVSQSDIDGALVGGASLEADSFVRIIQESCLAAV